MAKQICTLFRELGITIVLILTTLSITISRIVLATISVFRGGGSPPAYEFVKDKETLMKWLNRTAHLLKRLTGKVVEAFPAIVGNVVGSILSFLENVAGFFTEHTKALNVFVAGIIELWLTQTVKK